MSKLDLLEEKTFKEEKAVDYEDLIGKTFHSVKDDRYTLSFLGDNSYMFYHEQGCCENVSIEDVCGDLSDLEGEPILVAQAVSTYGEDVQPKRREYIEDSSTWTFYKFSTIKGSVTVRWFGSSNGYYSESVDFKEI